MSSTHQVIADAQPIPPATEAETDAIWDQYEALVVPSGATSSVKHFHIPHVDLPRAPACVDRGGEPTEWTDLSLEGYPAGWHPVCRECLAIWRARRDGELG